MSPPLLGPRGRLRAPALLLGLLLLGLLGVAAGLAACERAGGEAAGPSAPAAEVLSLAGETMGTTWHVKVVTRSAEASSALTTLQPAIDAELELVNEQMSTWRPHSELSRFNQHATADPFVVSAATAEVVAEALELGRTTEGAFDVTLGPLIDLWGFDRGGRRSEPPSADEVAQARARVGLDKLRVQRGGAAPALVKTRPDLEVNLSGIAKGWGVDRVAVLLDGKGLTDYMVEVGGEVRTRGQNARGEPWKLGINVPRSDADPTAVLRTVSVSGRSLATSGNYRNFFESQGKRYAHILDPRTGAPTDHTLVSATILADTCTVADGLATAALVLGEERMRKVLATHYPGVEALFVHAPRADGQGELAHATDGGCVATSPGGRCAAQRGELKVTRTDGFPES